MRVRKKDQKNLVKVGVFITFLTLILMVIVTSIGKESSIFESKVTIRAQVPNVSNLKVGSYVELKGIRIGAVTGIHIISEEEVEIHMTILEKELRWIKKDSKVSISTAGLVGDKFVEIHKGSKVANILNPDKDILTSEEQTDFKKMMNKGDHIAEVTGNILQKLDHILTQMEDGRIIIETMSSMNKSAKNLESISTELKDAQMGDMVKNVNVSMASMNRILNRVEKGPGTINSLIYDENVHDDLRALLGGAQRNKTIRYFIRESIKKSEMTREQEDQ
jgi:phospholipid/cholesterol/gamma-HCH transport system substrate-binding protein